MRSLQQQNSPQRHTLSSLKTDPDSPSRQRIQLLSEKWNNIQNGIDKDKFDKKEVLEEKLRAVEDTASKQKPKDEQQFKVVNDSQIQQVLKDQCLKIQENSLGDQQDREVITNQMYLKNFNEKRLKDLEGLTQYAQTVLANERNLKVNNEQKQAKQLDEKFNGLSMTINRSSAVYGEQFQIKNNETSSMIKSLKAQLDNGRRERNDQGEALQDALDSELSRFQDNILLEKKVREETQSKIFSMIQEIHNRLQGEIAQEKKERECTTDALLKLLEDACLKIDRNFQQ